jgi:hypothetical protein
MQLFWRFIVAFHKIVSKHRFQFAGTHGREKKYMKGFGKKTVRKEST